MAEARTFFGGEAPLLATSGEVGGDRHYEGAGLGAIAAWTCPACRTDNVSVFEQGCPSCGAGKPGYHKGIDPPPAPAGNEDLRILASDTVRAWAGSDTAAFRAVKGDLDRGIEIYSYGDEWAAAHPGASIAEAFVAGYYLMRQRHDAQTLHAPPVTADVESLAPAGKTRRTILAALRLFRDQVLAQSPDEIESGEWCSVEEVEAVIQQLER